MASSPGDTASLEGRRLYLVAPARPDLGDLIETAVRGGVDVVQVREKALSDRELLLSIGRNLQQVYGDTLREPLPQDIRALLEKISAPTLLLRGAESDVLARDMADRMVQTIPDCRLVEVPDAGHSIPLDNPTGFREAMREFLG